MISGKTKNGFAFKVEETVISNNMEVLDLLVDVDAGDALAMPKLLRKLLPEEQRKALYDTLRDERGIVPSNQVGAALWEIIAACGGKKS